MTEAKHGIPNVPARYGDVPEYSRRFTAALARDDFRKAEEVLNELLKVMPSHPAAGVDLPGVRRHQMAIETIDRRIRKLMAEGNRSEARKALAKARWVYPENPLLQILRKELTRTTEARMVDGINRAVEHLNLGQTTESLDLVVKLAPPEQLGRKPENLPRDLVRKAVPAAQPPDTMGPLTHDLFLLVVFGLAPVLLIALLFVGASNGASEASKARLELGAVPADAKHRGTLAMVLDEHEGSRAIVEGWADASLAQREEYWQRMQHLKPGAFMAVAKAIVPVLYTPPADIAALSDPEAEGYDDELAAAARERVTASNNAIAQQILGYLNTPSKPGEPLRRVVVPPSSLTAKEWDPAAQPPELGIGKPLARSGTLITLGMLVAFFPALLFALILVNGRIPFVKRIFEFVWECWLVLPAWGLLGLGVVLIWPGLIDPITKDEPSAGAFLAGVLLGLLAVPHGAFALQQGFANILAPSPKTPRPFLVTLTLLSALASTTARLLGEGVVLLSAAMLFPETRNEAIALGGVLLDGLAWNQGMMLTQQAVAAALPSILMTTLLVCVGLSVLAQLLMWAVAHYGLAHVDEDPTLRPYHPAQRRVGKRSAWMTGIGLVATGLLALFAVLVPEMLPAKLTSPVAPAPTAVDAPGAPQRLMDAKDTSAAERGTLTVGLALAGVGGFAAMCFVLPGAMFIRRRRVRAMLECVWRVPLVVPPLAVVLGLIELFRLLGPAVETMQAPTMTTALTCLLVAFVPLGGVLILRAIERYRRPPFLPDVTGVRPSKSYRAVAVALEIVAVFPLLAALGVCAGELIALTGAAGVEQSPSIAHDRPVRHFGAIAFSLREHVADSPEFWTAFGRVAEITIGLLLFGLLCKMAAELVGLLALPRRKAKRKAA